MASNVSNDQYQWIIKQYWKTENTEQAQQKWAEEFDTPTSRLVGVLQTCDTFDKTGSISVICQRVARKWNVTCSSIYSKPK